MAGTRKKKPRRWVNAAMGSAPDPRVSVANREYGKRRVDRLVMTDSEGDAWDFIGDLPPTKLPRPPEK